MKIRKTLLLILTSVMFGHSCKNSEPTTQTFNAKEMKIRIAEIKIDSVYIDEYISILKEEAAASV